MHRMYTTVSVNLSHLASALMLELVDRGQADVGRREFQRLLYLTVKAVQRLPDVHLHRSLRHTEAYADLPDGICEDLCPDVFVILDDGIAYVHEETQVMNDPGQQTGLARVAADDEASVVTAALTCPGECIFIEPLDH